MAKQEHHGGILVLGASGQLGRMLRRYWASSQDTAPSHGSEVYWQYRRRPGPETHGHWLQWCPGDPVSGDLGPIRAILALWGVTPAHAKTASDLAQNAKLALQAQDLAREIGAGLVLHCSSAAVYEPRPAAPGAFPETRAGGQINAYGAAKLAMETALMDWAEAHPRGARAVSLRLANVVGADSLFAAIGGALGRSGDHTITLDQFDDGEGPWRSYLTMPDLAHVVDRLVASPPKRLPRVLNVAAPQPVAMEALARAAGCGVNWRPAPDSAARMVALDTSALRQIVPLPDRNAEDMIASWNALRGAQG